MAAPDGYYKLPSGQGCLCLELYLDDEYGSWCCGKGAPMVENRAERDLAAIKGREAAVREALARGDAVVEAGPFGMAQLGLLPVVADAAGGLWICSGTTLVRYPPAWEPRTVDGHSTTLGAMDQAMGYKRDA